MMGIPSQSISRFETAIIGRSEWDVTERRRRIFLTLAVTVAVPTIVVLDIINFFGFDTGELIADAVAVVVLLANLILVRFLRTGIWLYRLDALLIGSLLLYYMTGDLGDGTSVMWSFAYPLGIFFLLGKREGAVWTTLFFLGAAYLLFTGTSRTGPADFSTRLQVRFLVTFLISTVLAYSIESLRDRFEEESRALIGQLELALSEVKTLKGLLPMCANCKKVRDDRGYWKQIESYLRDHTDASFTHSICPECIRDLYPEYADQVLERDWVPGT